MDHSWVAPLCFAARNRCSSDVLELLVLHGAQWSDVDWSGRTAKDLLEAETKLPMGPIDAIRFARATGDSSQALGPDFFEPYGGEPTLLRGLLPHTFLGAFSPSSWPPPPAIPVGPWSLKNVGAADSSEVNLSMPWPDPPDIFASL
eukprot:TRINITY_DN48794_c0_g1_i1.p2 TRINITY_DN48794_c0_g1~~TRINITY_DN48794_c0_g1_i1.p2  ORF type:complete len:155 (+),score=23.31 TRINITY_DN48794_c0_g1_i1:30-467(+)